MLILPERTVPTTPMLAATMDWAPIEMQDFYTSEYGRSVYNLIAYWSRSGSCDFGGERFGHCLALSPYLCPCFYQHDPFHLLLSALLPTCAVPQALNPILGSGIHPALRMQGGKSWPQHCLLNDSPFLHCPLHPGDHSQLSVIRG